MPKQRDQQYFATLPGMSADFAAAVVERFETHCSGLRSSKRHERMRRAWASYYSRSRDGDYDDTELQEAGELGELTLIRPAIFRNLMMHQLNLVTQAPPGYECIAVNTDSESLAQAILGNGILDYYLRVHHLDDLRVRRAEIALLLGESFLSVSWDANAGNKFGVRELSDEEGNPVLGEDGKPVLVPVHEGELTFGVYTPYDVAYDPLSKDLQRPRWTITREPANRWDLIAEFPEHEERILQLDSYSSVLKEWGVCTEYDHDDYVPTFRVGVEKSPACPNGREARILDAETVLVDGDLSEDRVGVFRLAAADVIFQSGGHSHNHDVLPVAEAFHAQASTILSNHTVFGGQMIAAPKGSGVKPHQLGRGLSLLEYVPYEDATGRPVPPPGPMQMLATPPEVFNFLDWLERQAEKLSGIHAVMRGESKASDSGAKTALLHATAQQFSNQFHRNLSRSDEDVGSFVVASLRSHATTKRVATIAGKFNSFASKEFTGKDLDKISRVVVRTANPLRDTFQGRMELCDRLFGLKNPEDREAYIEVLNTGRFDVATEREQSQKMLIRRENEMLRDPTMPLPLVAPEDDHAQHIKNHACEYDDPAVRQNPAVRNRIRAHNQEHVAALKPGSPKYAGDDILMVTGQKPLPPLGAPSPANANGAPPPGARPPGPPGPPPPNGGPPPGRPGPAQPNGMPRLPSPPKNPLTGEPADVQLPEPASITNQ